MSVMGCNSLSFSSHLLGSWFWLSQLLPHLSFQLATNQRVELMAIVKVLGPILCPNTSRMISNCHRIQTPMNPTTIFGCFNFAQPEEWPSIWARIWVFPCPAFTPKAELHNAASPTWIASSVSVN